ncbi:MAG: J domain-containing protein [Burkholderiales bacterium]
MPKVHSHYENLKVARDASADEIRAAYRTLTRKHHPDRNPDNADAERVMSVINVAYGVLSDPARRSEHDRWIAQNETRPTRPSRSLPTLHAPTDRYRQQADAQAQADAQRARQLRLDRRVRRAVAHVLRHRLIYVAAGASVLCLALFGISALMAPGLTAPIAPAAPEVPKVAGYTRSPTAPNGEPWPARSGYVDGYPLMNKGGLSEIKVDNTRSESDMFVKLVSLDGPTAFPARTFFVAARAHLTLEGLTPGTYELRYRNLASGGLWRSPALILEEIATARGTQHSSMTVRLYTEADGSMKSFALLDTEF